MNPKISFVTPLVGAVLVFAEAPSRTPTSSYRRTRARARTEAGSGYPTPLAVLRSWGLVAGPGP